MKIKKFSAPSVKEALLCVKQEFGPQAVILKTEKIPRSFFHLSRGHHVEVTAAIDDSVAPVGSAQQALPASPKTRLDLTIESKRAASRGGPAAETAPLAGLTYTRQATRCGVSPAATLSGQAPGAELSRNLEFLHHDLREVKSTVSQLAEQVKYARMPSLPPPLARLYMNLAGNEVEERLAKDLLQQAFLAGRPELWDNAEAARREATQLLAQRLRVSGPIACGGKQAVRVVLAGPTGVGKTTSLAKLATHYILQRKKHVALIAADSYRIAALDQIKAFAEIAGLPVYTVFNAQEMAQAVERSRGYDLVLIDTAGHNQKNEEAMNELQQLLAAADPQEMHLVLSLTTKMADLYNIVRRYRGFPVNRYLFTKLDETQSFGSLLNLCLTHPQPLSYLGVGQEVPNDIRLADSASLAHLLLQGGSHD